MRVTETPIPGVHVLELEPLVDERGWFARSFCVDELAAHGIDFTVVQASISFNEHAGTLRGMHHQRPPSAEQKHIRCVRGAAFDVLVDLRPDSPAYCRWWGRELRAGDGVAVLAPEGVAHGFLTLAPETEIEYLISARYDPAAAAGVRWDDPAFGIAWPVEPLVMAERDRTFPDFRR